MLRSPTAGLSLNPQGDGDGEYLVGAVSPAEEGHPRAGVVCLGRQLGVKGDRRALPCAEVDDLGPAEPAPSTTSSANARTSAGTLTEATITGASVGPHW